MNLPNPDYRGNTRGHYGLASRGMNPATRRLMLFSAGLAGVLACLIGASTLTGHHGTQPVPVVAADTRPIRVKPDNPGGMQIDGAENDVFSVGANNGASRLNPAAEAPDPNGMQAQASSQKAAAVAREPAQVEAPPPVATPAARAAAAAPAVEAPAAPAQSNAAAAAGRPAAVQLAALTTEQAARSEWQLLTKRMPDLLNGRQPSFSRAERDGRTFWRLRTAGFPDVAQAKAFCERVKAKGGGCSVADF